MLKGLKDNFGNEDVKEEDNTDQDEPNATSDPLEQSRDPLEEQEMREEVTESRNETAVDEDDMEEWERVKAIAIKAGVVDTEDLRH